MTAESGGESGGRAPKVVAIAQPANLGDVISCMPMAGIIKQRWPNAKVILIGRPYTQVLVEACANFDEFLDVDEVLTRPEVLKERGVDVFVNPFLVEALGQAAHQASVPIRVGNLRRPRTVKWANRFIFQGSKQIPLHIANLNLRHLRPIGIKAELTIPQLAELIGLSRIPPLRADLAALLDPQRFNLILHPKSNKNGREWPAAYWNQLIDLLPAAQFKIFITGQSHERDALRAECPALVARMGDGTERSANGQVVDLMDRLDLPQLLAFIRHADGLVAAGTGPLHLAAALGIYTLGLFPGRDRSNAVRWHPLGTQAEALSFRASCEPGPGRCPRSYAGEECSCMTGITPASVAQRVLARGASNPLHEPST